MVRKIYYVFMLLVVSPVFAFSQSNGSAYYKIDNESGEMTKKVNVWGYVKNPGRYEVPISTNLIQIIAYAGGPRDHALMDEIKVYKNTETGSSTAKEVDLENPSRTREADLQLNNEDTIIIDHSSSVTIGEIFGFIAAPLAIVTSIILIADRIQK
ncbi:MAG: SLBB domain-containing protein [Bacillota bacterium]